MASGNNGPFPDTQLQQITKRSCDTVLSSATSYIHAETDSWNTAIINHVLESLTSTTPATDDPEAPTPSERPQYKYAVNSTIIQHLSDPTPSTSSSTGTSTDPSQDESEHTQTASPSTTPNGTSSSGANGVMNGNGSVNGGTSGSAQSAPEKGRRGMHSATGAYWNNETDGMWNYKWEGGEKKGMDVVVSIIWVAV